MFKFQVGANQRFGVMTEGQSIGIVECWPRQIVGGGAHPIFQHSIIPKASPFSRENLLETVKKSIRSKR